jgi:gas vesicle protein
VIESIRNHDPDLAQKIMDKMFVFDDLIKLDDKAIQMVLKEVASDTLIAALKGAQPELKEKILANMSSRAAETLREDLESRAHAPVRGGGPAEGSAQDRAPSGGRRADRHLAVEVATTPWSDAKPINVVSPTATHKVMRKPPWRGSA